jgi:hypothetical protein
VGVRSASSPESTYGEKVDGMLGANGMKQSAVNVVRADVHTDAVGTVDVEH